MTFMKKAIASLAALGARPASRMAQEMKKEIGPGEGQVDIVAWPGYIERGETDKDYDWVTGLRSQDPAARSTSRPPAPRTKWSR